MPECRFSLEAGHRGAALTADLLSFAKRRPVEPELLAVDDCVAGMGPLLRRAAGAHFAFAVSLDAAGSAVFVSPTALDQVLMNLVVNAADAMPAGGSIQIGTSHSSVPQGGLVCVPDRVEPGDYVCLTVQDSGHGMSSDTIERIFEPFFTTKEAKGTGLGLATCYGIVKQFGGAMGVTSTPGEGTTFSVFLPRLADGDRGVEDMDAPADVPTLAEGGETVLVVDDDGAVRNAVSRSLRRAGFAVLEASSGGEALVVLERHDGPIDLLLTDIVMPYMDGTEVARAVQTHRPGLPVLFMSGFHDADIGVDARVLPKPFTPQQLVTEVQATLSESEDDPAEGSEGLAESFPSKE